jgi:hypothetical protein
MEIKTLAGLQQPDETSLMFTPWGLAKMTADQAAEYGQRLVAQYELPAQVPETTKLAFDRVRTIYSYGVLCYELYTVAGDQARLTLEQALRDRFIPFHGGTVNFADGQGRPQPVTADDYETLSRAIRRDDGRLRGWKLVLTDGRKIAFNGMLTSLLRWARAEHLLGGQHDRLIDRFRIDLRDYAAHPGYHLEMPGDAADEIADLARIISRLWGNPHGTPIPREIMIVSWDQRTTTWALADRFAIGPIKDAETCLVVRASPDAHLADYDALYETVPSPCDYLWGPGTLPDALTWISNEQPPADSAQVLDRLFMARHASGQLYWPQSVPVAAGLDPAHADGTWYLIRADNPADALGHLRRLLAGDSGHAHAGQCSCPAETITGGTRAHVLRRAAALGSCATSKHVPDIRTPMARPPRSVEISPRR